MYGETICTWKNVSEEIILASASQQTFRGAKDNCRNNRVKLALNEKAVLKLPATRREAEPIVWREGMEELIPCDTQAQNATV